MKKWFGSYENTTIWFREYRLLVKELSTFDLSSLFDFSKYVRLIKLGFKFPVVYLKDFFSLSSFHKTVTVSTFLLFFGCVTIVKNKLQIINENEILKCDCSVTRDNDSYYSFWYSIGNQYGIEIPKYINVEKSINNEGEFGRYYFSLSWIKNWIYINGSRNIGGIPNMKIYLECWEKGYLEGRNSVIDK